MTLRHNLNWSQVIDNISATACWKLGIMRRRLKGKLSPLKLAAYKRVMRSSLEYASSVCNPQSKTYINKLDKIQTLIARFILNRYERVNNASAMLRLLNFSPPCERGEIVILKFLKLTLY